MDRLGTNDMIMESIVNSLIAQGYDRAAKNMEDLYNVQRVEIMANEEE